MNYEYCGVIHVHTIHSDGSGNIDTIIDAAKKAKLDFVILTDHNTLRYLEEGQEGWRDKVLVLVGEEISSRKNHYLALGISKTIEPSLSTRKYVEEVTQQGGIGFIAHPHFPGKPAFFIFGHRWDAWDILGWTGMEIWSYLVDWLETLNYFNFAYFHLHPEKLIKGPPPENLKKWDEFAQIRPVVGICGVDAHARPLLPFGRLKSLPYHYVFSALRNHILLPEPLSGNLLKDKTLIYQSLKKGNCFFAYDLLTDSTSFRYFAHQGEVSAIMGEILSYGKKINLEVKLPEKGEIHLIHNGELRKSFSGRELNWEVKEKGTYRIEVYLKNKPWIFSNPIYIK